MSNVVKPPPSCNVYTPAVLAQAMVRALGDVPDARWLEPCVGNGALLKALARHRVDASRIVGLDLCRSPEPADVHAVVRRGIDFLRWSRSTTERFDRVVANPPYVALSKVPRPIQNAALRVRTPDGTPIALGGNCWNAFLCAVWFAERRWFNCVRAAGRFRLRELRAVAQNNLADPVRSAGSPSLSNADLRFRRRRLDRVACPRLSGTEGSRLPTRVRNARRPGSRTRVGRPSPVASRRGRTA